ncbi:MAG TPA: hypothetical protein VNU46_02170 [Gemmatimonadaceae bacterium]|jgi:PIN domain nuclease of toxin-antitoxin system|nr:hypothetical protein [Gemmatimonadaceae bacterium]
MPTLDASALGAPRRLLLDSAVWIAATMNVSGVVSPELLLILEQAAHEGRLWTSAAVVWELALLARRGDIYFGDFSAWLADQKRPPGVTIHPMTEELAYESTVLPGWMPSTAGSYAAGAGGVAPSAPATAPTAHALPSSEAIDRFLVATAYHIGAVLVTTDPALLAYAASGGLEAYDARPSPVTAGLLATK